MFNLLPDSLKDKIKNDYKLRRVIVVLFFLLFIQFSFLIFMFPSLVVSYYKEKETQLRVDKFDESELVSSVNTIKPIIRSLNSDLATIDKTLDYSRVIPFFDMILSKKTSSIRITDFSYTNISSSNITISIQGVGATRDSLVNFKKDLEESNLFKSVDLPISNLAKDKNITFSMNISVKI